MIYGEVTTLVTDECALRRLTAAAGQQGHQHTSRVRNIHKCLE